MRSNLKQLLEKIDYRNLFEEDQRRVDHVLTRYRSVKNTIGNYNEFQDCLINFVSQIYSAIINVPKAFDTANRSIMYDLALTFLKSKYPRNTERTLYEIMHSGSEGGVYRILKTLAKIMSEKIYQDGIEYHVALYLNEMDFEEKEAAVKEYIKEYGSILPGNYQRDPISIMISFDKVLQQHPIMMKRLRELQNIYPH
jgi:hypothetical protein